MPHPTKFHNQTPEFLVPGEQVARAIHELGLHTDECVISCTIPNYRMMLAASAFSDRGVIIPNTYLFHLLIRALPQDQLYPTVPRWARLGPKGRAAHNRCGVLTALFAENDSLVIDVPIHSHLGLRHGLLSDWPTQSTLDLVFHQWTHYMREQAKYKICDPIVETPEPAPEPADLVYAPNGAFA